MAIDILGSARRSTRRYNGARRRDGLRATARSGSIGSVCHDDLLPLFHPASLACCSSNLKLYGKDADLTNPFSLDLAALFNRLVSAN
jgi:hypothetical protein